MNCRKKRLIRLKRGSNKIASGKLWADRASVFSESSESVSDAFSAFKYSTRSFLASCAFFAPVKSATFFAFFITTVAFSQACFA